MAGRTDRCCEPMHAYLPSIELPPLLPKAARLQPPVGVKVSTTAENLRRLKRVERCGAVEQVSVSRRANHATASYHGQYNYRAPI